ncbi:MAG TPA: TfoX/Sxy family protein [Pseudomonadota bacterium]|jgi:TfoX/Sxy family transcriptional regulator of competence genes|nr:TfoX/Sxy family protein [Pseudomonadota bacterium]
MASKQSTADFFLDQFSGAGNVTAKRMFGEFGIYLDGKMFALLADDQLFVKPTDKGRALLGTVQEGCPYPGSKPAFLISGDRVEDADFLCELAKVTASELPLPKPKPPKAKKK